MNFRVASVDSFGDRDDIALARDRAQGQIRENQADQRLFFAESLLRATTEYGTSDSAENISEIVLSMIRNEVYSKTLLKAHIVWDVDSIWEAVNEACIRLGLGDDEYSPWTNDLGNKLEITLC
jgi:hypothetical protein